MFFNICIDGVIVIDIVASNSNLQSFFLRNIGQ